MVARPDDGVDYRPMAARDLLSSKGALKYLPQRAVLDKTCVFHLHGLWSPSLHLVARFAHRHGLPYVVSTRGMAAGWSLAHKPFKKKLAWRLYQQADLQRAACLLASSDAEFQDLTALLPGCAVAVVANCVDESPEALPEAPCAQPGSTVRTLLAMGRLHPVKGYAELIEAWATLRPAGWRLLIAGPDEDGYRAKLQALISARGLSDQVQLLGEVDDLQKWRLLADCDLFAAPSRTENFGMAIAEAMLAGKPVITTTGTPWRLLAEQRAGWWVDLTPDALLGALRESTALNDGQRGAMGQRARHCARRFSPESVGREVLGIYRWLLEGAARPACVGGLGTVTVTEIR